MARLIFAAQALNDLERLPDFLRVVDPDTTPDTYALIEEAITILGRHPLIGRPVEHGLRELVISKGHTGYVALFSFEAEYDAVLVLALRQQREAGYSAAYKT